MDSSAPSESSVRHPGDGPRDRSLARTLLLGVIGLPISGLLLWFSLRRTDWQAVRHALLDVQWPWLIAVLVSFGVTFGAFAFRWKAILGRLGDLNAPFVLMMIVAAAALNNVIPGRAGEPMRAFWASRATRRPLAMALGTLVVDRAADILLLVGLLFAVAGTVPHPPWFSALLLGGGAAALVLIVILVSAEMLRERRSKSLAGEADHASGANRWAHFRRVAVSFLRGLVLPRGDAVVRAAAWTVVAWLAWCGGAYACARAVGIDLGITEVALLAAVLNLGLAIPSSPGFVGTFQWLVVEALGLVGIDRSHALAYSLVLHFMALVPVTIVGAVVLLRFMRGVRGRR